MPISTQPVNISIASSAMKPPKRSAYPLPLFLLVLVAALLLPVFSGHAADVPKTLRVGYQKYGSMLLVKAQGSLEKRLAPLGYAVEWKEFVSGPPLFEALNAGSIDLGHAGNAPPVFAQAAGVNFVYFANSGPAPKGIAIVVPKGSPIQKPADLRGKKIAVAKGTNANFFLTAALPAAGLSLSDVQIAYLAPPDARAAFAGGSVDAWAVWDPFLAAAEVDLGARQLVNGEGLTTNREFFFGRRESVEKNAPAVAALVAELEAVGVASDRDRRATAALLAPKLGISLGVMEHAELRKDRAGIVPITAEAVGEQQAIADTFLKLGLIPKPVVVKDAVLAGGGSAATTAARPAVPGPKLDALRLDYAYYNPVSLVIKDQGLLEKEYAAEGTKVEWVLSLGSNKALEFLRAKAVDFGSTAGAAALIGRANGNPIKSVYLYSNPEWTALVTRPDTGIKTIADLRGKKVAVTRGPDPHIFLLRALASAGMTERDIELIPLQHPDGKVALQNKSVAAWSGLDPYIAQTQVENGFPVFYRNRDWNSGGFLNVHETFAKEHPDAVTRVRKIYEQARVWAIEHPAETKAILAREAKLTPEVVDRVWERTDLTHPAIGDASREGITAAGEVLKRSGIIDAGVDVPKTVNDLIAPGFGEKALAAAGK